MEGEKGAQKCNRWMGRNGYVWLSMLENGEKLSFFGAAVCRGKAFGFSIFKQGSKVLRFVRISSSIYVKNHHVDHKRISAVKGKPFSESYWPGPVPCAGAEVPWTAALVF